MPFFNIAFEEIFIYVHCMLWLLGACVVAWYNWLALTVDFSGTMKQEMLIEQYRWWWRHWRSTRQQ